MVVQSDACGEPRAVVVHLQHAFLACATVVRAVRLAGLALLAEANIAIGLDGEGGGARRGVRG